MRERDHRSTADEHGSRFFERAHPTILKYVRPVNRRQDIVAHVLAMHFPSRACELRLSRSRNSRFLTQSKPGITSSAFRRSPVLRVRDRRERRPDVERSSPGLISEVANDRWFGGRCLSLRGSQYWKAAKKAGCNGLRNLELAPAVWRQRLRVGSGTGSEQRVLIRLTRTLAIQ
jgi:hypothetical protein